MCVCVCAQACVSLSWQLSLIDSCRPSGLHCNPSAPGVIGGQGFVAPRRRSGERGGGTVVLRPCPTVGQHAVRSCLDKQQRMGWVGDRVNSLVKTGEGREVNHKGTMGPGWLKLKRKTW